MARLLVKAEIVQSARASFISEAEAHTARTTHYLQYSSCLSLIPSSGTPAIIHQCFSVTVMHTHACARTYAHAMRHLPPCLRDPGALLEDNEEETLSLLEHVRQIRHRRPRRPQIHPSSSCPPNQHCKETERAMGHKVQKRLEIAVKSRNRKEGEEEARGGRNMREM